MTDNTDDLHARFTALLASIPPPTSPSPRTPRTSTHFNSADNIERQLHSDKHSKWGFVIYRCTATPAARWDTFMAKMEDEARESLDCFSGADMLDSLLPLTVVEAENWDAADVRAHLWEQRGEGEVGRGESQRYRYPIRVDAAALESVLQDGKEGWVELVWEGEEEEEEEGEGEDGVGWAMRVDYRGVMVGMYDLLRGQDAWEREYRRPPKVAR